MAKKRRKRLRGTSAMLPRGTAIGAAPGTISPLEDALPTTLRCTTFTPGSCVEHPVTTVKELIALRREASLMWIQVEGVADAGLLRTLGTNFGLHTLALEDAAQTHQRPKVEDYEGHGHIVLLCPSGVRSLALDQLSIFVGDDFVITIQDGPQTSLAAVGQRLQRKKSRLRTSGTDFFAYTIVDVVVDHYFPVVDRFNSRIEELEASIFSKPTDHVIAEIHELRQELHVLRRVLIPTREAITQLGRGGSLSIDESIWPFLRDCRDHTAQLLDSVNACSDLSKGLMEMHMSRMSQRMNETMSVLTMIATIFIPMSFIAGVYGMNFDVSAGPLNMPELQWANGYPFALGLMLATATSILLYFRSRGWLGNRPRRRRPVKARKNTDE